VNRQDLYRRLPLPAQQAMAAAYGVVQLPIRHGGRFRSDVRDLDARQWWSPDRLQRDQDQRVRAMVLWCAHRVPHYRDLFAELGLDASDVRTAADLVQLPMLDKESVRADPERFLPDPPRPKLVAQTTGGTTGTPLAYWATKDAVRFNYATYESRTRAWSGVRFGDRMASFHGQPIVPAGQERGPFWRRNPAFNQLYCSVYHLSDANLPAYLDALAAFRPVVLAGYTSAIHRLAQYVLRVGDTDRIRPRAVIVSSETLLPAARADIEAAFGCPVHNAYSLGELVAYVSECDFGSMHVSTEYGVLELLDTDESAGTGRHEIVASGLFNRAMPLLRYRTGDTAAPATATCECGRGLPTVDELTGRSDDVVHTPDGTIVGPAPMSLAFQRVPRLRRAQVHQDRIESIRVLVEVDADFTVDDESFMVAELAKRLGTALEIEVERVEALPRTSGGKERVVVSTLHRDGAGR
jgi:phenylacetate-CoA ligase